MKALKLKIRLENARHKKFFLNHLRGWRWLVTTVTPPLECTTEDLRTGASEIIGERGRDRLFFYGLVIQRFPEILKNNCNEKLLKIGITRVGKIKIRAGKGRTHSKSFSENIAKVFRALNTPIKRSLEKITMLAKHAYHQWCFQKLLLFLMFFKKFCIYKH